MAEKNIEMNVMNESGGYDVLYPKTTPEQAGSLSISGGTMQGDLILNRDPVSNLGAASKQYVENYVGGLVNTGEMFSDKWVKVFEGTFNGTGWNRADFKTCSINFYFSEFFAIMRNITLYGEAQGEIKVTRSDDTGGDYGVYIMNSTNGNKIDYDLGYYKNFVNFSKGYLYMENEDIALAENPPFNIGIWSSVKTDIEIYVR